MSKWICVNILKCAAESRIPHSLVFVWGCGLAEDEEKKDRAQPSALRTGRPVRATVRGERREEESGAQAAM